MGTEGESPRHVLEYSIGTKRLAQIHFGFCILFTVCVALMIAGAFFGATPEIRSSLARSAAGFGALLSIHYFLYYRVVRPRANTRFHVYGDRIEIEREKKRSVARYDEIAKLYGRVYPSLGGDFGFVLKSGAIQGFSATLPGGERILEAIGESIPARKAELAELRANLIVCHHGYARIIEYFRGGRAFFTALHLFLIPFAFTAYMVGRQGKVLVIAAPASFFVETALGIFLAVFTLAVFFGYALNQLIDRPTLDLLAENPDARARNLIRERRILRDAAPVYLFALSALLGLYNRFDLNTLSRTETSVEVPHLGLAAGQTLWIDERANCVECAHGLREGELVVFLTKGSPTLGRLVGLPGASIDFSGTTSADRAPASDRVTIPAGKVAIRSNPNGDLLQIVDLADIRGRADEDIGRFFRSHD